MQSTPIQKALASAINVSIVTILSLPIYLVSGWEVFRISIGILFALYNIVFRKGCIGMMIVGTTIERPASLMYIALYTMSFETMFWTWRWPLDIPLFNLVCLQIPCVIFTGNTFHGFLCGEGTIVNDAHERQRGGRLCRLEGADTQSI